MAKAVKVIFVERVHGRDELFVQIQQVVGLAQSELHSELSKIGRIPPVTPRVPLMHLHHMVVKSRKGSLLVVIPEPLRIGHDALVQDPLAPRSRRDPARRDPHHLVVPKAIKIRTQHVLGLESAPEKLAGGARGDDLVRQGVGQRHLETDLLFVDLQLSRENLVNGENLVQPANGCVNRLLFPLCRGIVLGETDGQLFNGGAELLRRKSRGLHGSCHHTASSSLRRSGRARPLDRRYLARGLVHPRSRQRGENELYQADQISGPSGIPRRFQSTNPRSSA